VSQEVSFLNFIEPLFNSPHPGLLNLKIQNHLLLSNTEHIIISIKKASLRPHDRVIAGSGTHTTVLEMPGSRGDA
jgi:hypothetical protein